MWRWRLRTDEDFTEEIQAAITLETDRLVAEGLSQEEARRAALRAFGNVARARERFYESRRLIWLDDLRRDIAYAFRMLLRSPGFTVVAVVTLALGIGANTAIFSVVSGVLLRPLPYKDSDRIVRLLGNFPAEESPSRTPLRSGVTLSISELRDVRSRVRSVTHVGLQGAMIMGLSGAEEGARLQGYRLSATVFSMLNARALIGRVWHEADEVPGGEAVVLLSYAMWQKHFASDPDILGRELTFSTVLGPRRQSSYAVVGVMPPEFQFPASDAQFWMPYGVTAPAGGQPPRGSFVARLAENVTTAAAAAELGPIVRAVRNHSPRVTYELVRPRDELATPVKPALLILTVAVGFVLLIACINVANLLLARTSARGRELSVRTALGAGRGRIMRQLLTESVLLSIGSGMAGLVLAWAGVRLFAVIATTDTRIDLGVGRAFPRLEELGLDLRALTFMTAVSLISGLLFGLAPALRHGNPAQADALRESASTAYSGYGSFRKHRGRGVLIVVEIAMAMILLVGAGLLIRSFVKLTTVDVGYSSANVLTFQVGLPVDAYPDARLKAFAEELVAQLNDTPGVQAAAYANQLPMVALQDSAGGLFKTPDPTRKPPQPGPDARVVSRDYLRAMGIGIVAGRGFDERDREGRPRALIVNETLAQHYYPGERPLGQFVYIGSDVIPWEIVGLATDVRQMALDREPEPQFFADFRQWQVSGVLFPVGAYYVVRTTETSGSIVARIRTLARDLEPQSAIFNVAPMQHLIDAKVSRPRMYAVLLGIFAGVAVMLAGLGIYGVLAYAVSQRTREIGVRMALGAEPAAVIRLVLGQTAALTAAGIVLGLAGAAAATRYLHGMLFGVTPLDTMTFVVVALLFVAVAMLAAFVPARRATKVDPLEALRCE
jgi:predicted permease